VCARARGVAGLRCGGGQHKPAAACGASCGTASPSAVASSLSVASCCLEFCDAGEHSSTTSSNIPKKRSVIYYYTNGPRVNHKRANHDLVIFRVGGACISNKNLDDDRQIPIVFVSLYYARTSDARTMLALPYYWSLTRQSSSGGNAYVHTTENRTHCQDSWRQASGRPYCGCRVHYCFLVSLSSVNGFPHQFGVGSGGLGPFWCRRH